MYATGISKGAIPTLLDPNLACESSVLDMFSRWPLSDLCLVPCSLAVVVESCHITICYTIGVYMVHHFLDKSADESQIGTLTGLLVCGDASAHAFTTVLMKSCIRLLQCQAS